ncbi:LytTR family DNA-binding domain-containing protein [Flavicella sp.]|uniref:LytR/AlgR family response regulator transcription factor n=1 Tax=Flavicella sp. TaxID=2957742 RepID=UPI0030170DD6
MINCIIIEDQLPAQRILKKYIKDADSMNLVGVFSNAFLALEALEALESLKIDLIFLDIHLPRLSGIEFLKSLTNPPKVILTTAFSDYALESYELAVVDYLLKPFSFGRFVKAVSKVSETKSSQGLKKSNPCVYIKSGHQYFKVEISSILFVNADGDYTDVCLAVKKHVSSEPLKYWEDKLVAHGFIRVHKSHLINTEKIVKTSSSYVYLENNHKIPIGRTYKRIVIDQLTSL